MPHKSEPPSIREAIGSEDLRRFLAKPRSLQPSDRLDLAFRTMRRTGDTAIAITDRKWRLQGVLALRHFERVIPAAGRWPTAFALYSSIVGAGAVGGERALRPVLAELKRFEVREAMDSPGPQLPIRTTVRDAIARLDGEGVNVLPVTDDGYVVGLVRLEELFVTHALRAPTLPERRLIHSPPIARRTR